MSGTQKRTLSHELESEETKGLVIPSRLLRPPTKRRKTEDSPEVYNCSDAGGDQRVTSKGKRQAWTAAAIEAFFEGLYQHGKHFHRILKHMQSKQKKLNDPLIPKLTKDQVRFYYYRTWHKVEPHLDAVHQVVCDPPRKVKQPQSSNDNKTAGADGENHLDVSLEEEEVSDLSPKKSLEIGDGSTSGDLLASSPTSLESCDKVKEQIGASPSEKQAFGPYMYLMIIDDESPHIVGDLCAPHSLHATLKSWEGPGDKAGDSKVKDVVVNGKKQSLDLVALICYHKLKQKCQVDHNFWKRLSELVYHGTTTIPSRMKGKRRIQIKVPNCVALRGKLGLPLICEDQIVDRDEGDDITDHRHDGTEQDNSYRNVMESDSCLSVEGPLQVTLELRPLTASSWTYIQGLSQNPRIRITVGASKRLVELLQMLSVRWKIDRATINIYHTYSTQNHTGKGPVMRESHLKDSNVTKPSNVLCRDMSDKKLTDGIDKVQATSDDAKDPSCRDDLGVAEASCRGMTSTCTSSLEDEPYWPLEYNPHTTLEHIHNQFCQPECVQLLYSIAHAESSQLTGDRLKILMKIVDLITVENSVDNQNLTQTPKRTPVKVASVAHQSSKVVEYMKSLERRSPRKSPLAKYHKLRKRSPRKLQLNPLKSKLNVIVPQSTPDTSSILSTMTDRNTSTEVIHLSNVRPSVKLKGVDTSSTATKLQDGLTKGDNDKLQMCSLQSSSNAAIVLQPGHHVLWPRHSDTACSVSLASTSSSVPTITSNNLPVLCPSPVTESIQSLTSQQTSSSSVPVVSSLKPFSKPRRTKKALNRTGLVRQLVPRPLPFLPRSQESSVGLRSHSLLPSVTTTLNLPLSAAREINSAQCKERPSVHNNQHKLGYSLLQVLAQQQIQEKQQQNIVSNTATSSSLHVAENEIVNVSDSHIGSTIPGILDNVLNPEEKTSIFNTSSDTVNKLLRGLSSTNETDSIRKLSEETASVLPSFAKALGQSSQPAMDGLSFHQLEDKNSDALETVVPECLQDPLSSISLSDFQEDLIDSTSKPIMEGENMTKSNNLGDVQLREVLMSPNELETDQEATNRQARDNSDRDPTYRSLMEESSIDYIQQFKELASSMDKESISS